MRILELAWDDYRVEHIARHGVTAVEVWQACADPQQRAHRQGDNRYRVYGQTAGGRYLFIVLEQVENATYKPITARDMTEGEKQGFRRLQRK